MNRTYAVRAILVVLGAFAFQSVGAVSAGSARQLQDSLGDLNAIAKEAGYRPINRPHTGLLAQGASERVAIDLPASASNRVSAWCDDDCSNLDLKLYDTSGNLVASDTAPDEVPGVAVTTTSPSRYSAEIIMRQCKGSTCGYMVSLYTK